MTPLPPHLCHFTSTITPLPSSFMHHIIVICSPWAQLRSVGEGGSMAPKCRASVVTQQKFIDVLGNQEERREAKVFKRRLRSPSRLPPPQS
eukprot:5420987-Lingulodinium_polyedra.AAC.1